jgi:hypothetical protein
MKSILILLIFLVTSCHPLSCGWTSDYDIVTEKPRSEKILGNYILSKESQKFLKNDFKNWPMNLNLSNDGRYKFFNQQDQLIKEGKWLLYCDGKAECLMELEGITVEPLGLKETDIAILITIGDGDSCEGIAYEKVN